MSLEVPSQQAPASLAYNLAGIAAIVLLAAIGAAYMVDGLGRSAHVPLPTLADGDVVDITIAGAELAIPAAWFRQGEEAKPGFSREAVLGLMPELGGGAVPVEVTLLPRSRARASAALLDTVYLHQFGDETLESIAGLVGKPLIDGDGGTGDTVWYDPLGANPFVAKCLAPLMPGAEAQCLRTVHLDNGIAAAYAFSASALPLWRQFDGAMEQWLSRIGAL